MSEIPGYLCCRAQRCPVDQGKVTPLPCCASPRRGEAEDWSTTRLAQTQPRKASNGAGKRTNVLKIPKAAGICFLSKHHLRVLLDSSLRISKTRFNFPQLSLELVDQHNCFSLPDQAGERCCSSSSSSCPEHRGAGGQRTPHH